MKDQNKLEETKEKWSRPKSLKELSQIFDVHRNTMSKWLENQTVCNRQLSPRKWQVALFELPYDIARDNISNII